MLRENIEMLNSRTGNGNMDYMTEIISFLRKKGGGGIRLIKLKNPLHKK